MIRPALEGKAGDRVSAANIYKTDWPMTDESGGEAGSGYKTVAAAVEVGRMRLERN